MVLNWHLRKLNNLGIMESNIEKINEENYISENDILNKALNIYMEYCKSNLDTNAKTYSTQLDTFNSKEIKELFSIKDKESSLEAYYIVNFENGGFIILSADKRIPEVLAYSEKSNFHFEDENISLDLSNENIPLGTQFWLNDMKTAISLLRTENFNIFENENNFIATYSKEETLPVGTYGPYLTTKWGQREGYNSQTPFCSSNERGPAGCGPIAVGQIMRYWKHSANSKYNWAAMVNNYATTETANLLADLYVATNSFPDPKDNCKTTLSYDVDLPRALHAYGYSCTSFEPFEKNEAFNNIANKRPFMLFGRTTEGDGHFWICEGYSKDNPRTTMGPYFYMNWGWYGEYDGWYSVGSAMLSSKYNFLLSSLRMAYNIYPN
jgi:hypothetical protein